MAILTSSGKKSSILTNVSQMSKNLESRLNAAYSYKPAYTQPKSNFLLDVLDVISRPGYAANNAINAAMKGESVLGGIAAGFSGSQKTEGSELFENLGVKDKTISSVAGFVWDVLNPLDPVNYLGFGLADDAIKGSLKGASLLTKAFGKYGDEIADVLGSVSTKIDDLSEIGASSVGQLTKKVFQMAPDGETKTLLRDLISKGLTETGNVATTKLPYNSLKSVTVGLSKNPLFGTPSKYHKIPGSKYLTAPITLAFRGIGKTGVGNALSKAFKTSYVPNTVPDSVIIKALNRLDEGINIEDIVTTTIDDLGLKVGSGTETYEAIRSGLGDLYNNIRKSKQEITNNVNILFHNVKENESKLITELLSTGSVKFNNGERIVQEGIDIDKILSPQAQTAMEGFANMLNDIPRKYSEAGIDFFAAPNYVPRQPLRPLKQDEASFLKEMIPNTDSAVGNVDEFVSQFDPSLKSRKIGTASPKQINDMLVAQGKKPWLNEDAASLMAMRGIRADQGLQAQQFMKNLTETFGITPGEFDQLANKGLGQGYNIYRMSASDTGKPILTEIHSVKGAASMVENGAKIEILPDDFAKMFNEYTDMLFGVNKKNSIAKVFDAATSWYKKLAYLWNPGHIVRDFSGNVWNGYLMGVRNPKYYKYSGELLKSAHEATTLKSIRMTVEGLSETGQPITRTLIEESPKLASVVSEGASHGDVIRAIDGLMDEVDKTFRLGNKDYKASKIYDFAKGNGILEVGYAASDTPETLLEGIRKPVKGNIVSRAEQSYTGKMRKWTESTDGFTRMAGFVQQLDSGKKLNDAAKMVKKYYFDYFDLTDFEKKVMKRAIPFYTWMRKNIPLQVSELLQNPRKYRPIQSAADALNQDGTENWDDKPQYIREMAAMMLGGSGLMFSPNLPYQDLSRIGNLDQMTQDLLSSINPIFRVPVEMALNKNFFTNDSIEEYEGETDKIPTAGILKMLGVKDEDIPRLNKRGIAYILRQIPFLNNLDTMANPESSRFGSRWSTFIGGPSLYDAEQAKTSAQYEEYNKLNELIRKLRDEGVYIPTLEEVKNGRN